MLLKCPKCGDRVDASDFAAGDRIVCPQCQTRLKLPTDAPDDHGQPFDFDDAPAPRPRPAAPIAPTPYSQPLLVPMPYAADPPEFVQEQIEDLRDRREDRRERRANERDDRVSNGVGIAGFALCVTATLLVLSGAIFANDLKVYAWFAALLGLVLTLIGLPCGIIGSLRPGRSRLFAIIGASLGGLLLLGFLPALMISLTSSK